MNDVADGERRIAVITVHGTGDTADTPDGQKWFQKGSAFASRLTQRLASEGIEAQIHPLLWSGANSAAERERGSSALVKLIKRLAKSHEGVHVIGHSHGGNVMNDAACMLNWSGRRRRSELSSLTTVGTPFFRTHVTALERFGAWAFGAVAALSLVLLLAVVLLIIATAAGQIGFTAEWLDEAGNVLSSSTTTAELDLISVLPVAGFIAAGLVALVFVSRLAFQGVARIFRASRELRKDRSVFAIWHPNDEAIAFLKRIEALRVEPFPRGSLLRGSRTGAIVWGVNAVIILPMIGVAMVLEDQVLRRLGYAAVFPDLFGVLPDSYDAAVGSLPNTLSEVGWLLSVSSLIAAPLVFVAVYAFFRLMAGAASELAVRPSLNRLVDGALRSIAFGRDGDYMIGEVSPRSHYYATTPYVISGEVAARMNAASSVAAQRLFDKYRSGIFNVESDQSEVLNQIAVDALTWDSLVHTTYFDQPEVADAVAGYIADVALNRSQTQTTDSDVAATTPRRRGRTLVASALAVSGVVVVAAVAGLLATLPVPILNRDQLSEEASIIHPPAAYASGDVLRDCEHCPELVVLAGGAFVMGSATTEEGRGWDEGPLHRVTIQPLAVGRYELARGQWLACVQGGGCTPNGRFSLSDIDFVAANLRSGSFQMEPMDLSWREALDYVRWLSAETGHDYRLLTEAEWEYAARAGTRSAYSWGNDRPVCDRSVRNGANFLGASFGVDPPGSCIQLDGTAGPYQTAPIGSYQPNPWGLFDMYGNASEWVEDCYTTSYARSPSDGSAQVVTPCAEHVLRGGDARSYWWGLRAAARQGGGVEALSGVRVARVL